MKLIYIESKISAERYEFLISHEDENYWYSKADVRFPKANFNYVKTGAWNYHDGM